MPDEKWVTLGPKYANDLMEKIQSHVKERAESGEISKFAVPDRIRFVEEIDKTSVGKIDKKALREKYAE